MSIRRAFGLAALTGADLVGGRGFGRRRGVADRSDQTRAALRWLCRSHDVTGRRGSSKAFSLLHGWLPAYPETTGYVIGTFLDRNDAYPELDLAARAREMGEWEIEVQNPDGGVMEGYVRLPPTPSVVFNTGMVLHGWLDLFETTGETHYLEAAERGGHFLLVQQPDGTWPPDREYASLPHTYNSRVDWALIRLAEATRDDRYRFAAVRNLDWVMRMQRPNGWFDCCAFRSGMQPSTHGLAYTMRGLLESGSLLGEERYVGAAQRTALAMADVYEQLRRLPATYDATWSSTSRSECLTGTAQVGGVWLRLSQLTGDRRLARLGEAAVVQAAAKQIRTRWTDVDGALPGSYPVYGRYAPFQFPNWAAKFLVDSLGLVDEVLSAPSLAAPSFERSAIR